MKYEKLSEPVFVNQVKDKHGKDGEEILEIQLTGIKTKTEYKTWVDPMFANWRHWQQIVEAAENKGVILSDLKFKDPAKNLINADSKPKIEYIVTREELIDELTDFWSTQQEFSNKFGPI